MIEIVSDNIVSPLGMTSGACLEAVLEGRSELKPRDGVFGLPEPCCVSLLDRDKVTQAAVQAGAPESLTFFERLCVVSAAEAITRAAIDPAAPDVLFVLSSTKGNVALLEGYPHDTRCFINGSAKRIARFFGNTVEPIVASNACISGVCAQIAAVRALMSGHYRHAVVTGADVLSRFIISGFQSFKALSPEPCRPYDRDRTGLNLGEAAGTIVLSRSKEGHAGRWRYAASSIHNDANHISGPSRTGEGSYRVLADILRDTGKDRLAFVNAHGTATAYNDEMESIALHRAGLDTVPLNGLKGYFGHTLGAAGVIETILSAKACGRGTILPTRGYATCGTTYGLDISPSARLTAAGTDTFIKMLSGFGGTNAGIAYTTADGTGREGGAA